MTGFPSFSPRSATLVLTHKRSAPIGLAKAMASPNIVAGANSP
jgi:hypothetical protein